MRSVPWPERLFKVAKVALAVVKSSTPPFCIVTLSPVVAIALLTVTTKLLVTTTLSLVVGSRELMLVEPVGSVVQMVGSVQTPVVPPPLNVYKVWPMARLLHKIANNPSNSDFMKLEIVKKECAVSSLAVL